MSDLDQLREIGQHLRQPAFEELLDTRRRRTRRSRVATASAVATAAVAVVGVLVAIGHETRTDPPPVDPSPTPTPTEVFEIPAGQQTIAPEIGPGDVHGFDVLATVTNSQPQHRDDSELSATVATHAGGAFVSVYCRGGTDLWYFYDREDGGGGFSRCSPNADTRLDPGVDIDDVVFRERADPLSMRMWIARPSAAYLDCHHGNTPECNAGYGVSPPVVDPDAEFGFGIYEHEPAPALRLFPYYEDPTKYVYEAVSTLNTVAWVIDRAVAAAPDADRLAFELPAKDKEYLVDVYDAYGPRFGRCFDQHQDELPGESAGHVAYEAALQELCYAKLRLVVDGTPVRPDNADPADNGHFTDLGARLSPGAVHQVEVQIVRGDPRNIRYAVIVRTRTQMP